VSTTRRCMVPSLPIRVTMTSPAHRLASPGRDTIFDWPATSAGTLDAGTAAARDAADFQPVIAPGDRTVPGSPPGSHAWHAWPLP
jgi:hypothetical protein